jgi:predicted nuclease with TOPRIM domain
MKQWEAQMGRQDKVMVQMGNVRQLMTSIEERQREMDQARTEAKQLQQEIAKSAEKWGHSNRTTSQFNDIVKKQQSLLKQTTKLENDVVQANAYWKKQWGELKTRVNRCEEQWIDELYVKQITLATLQAEKGQSSASSEWDAKEGYNANSRGLCKQ